MIRQLKLGFKLLPYAYRFKSNMIAMILFIVLGSIVKLYVPTEHYIPAELFVLMPSAWLSQSLYSLCVSGLIQASGSKKSLQTVIPVIISLISTLAGYVIVLVIEIIRLCSHRISSEIFILELMCGSIFGITILCYIGIGYKYYAVATAIMLIAIEIPVFINNMSERIVPHLTGISPVAGVVISLALIGAGALIQYGLSLLVYKKPLSKYAQYSMLKKSM